jgi:hypothetical protein
VSLPFSVIPTEAAGFFPAPQFGAPAAQWRDRGNIPANSQFDETISLPDYSTAAHP